MQLQIHGDTRRAGSSREKSPDYSRFAQTDVHSPDVAESSMDEDEHVLILDFEDNSRGQKMSNGSVFSARLSLPS